MDCSVSELGDMRSPGATLQAGGLRRELRSAGHRSVFLETARDQTTTPPNDGSILAETGEISSSMRWNVRASRAFGCYGGRMKDKRVIVFRTAFEELLESLDATVRVTRWDSVEAIPEPLQESA